MPQFVHNQAQWVNGQITRTSPCSKDSYVNELMSQITTITVGGTTNGLYSIQVVGEEGTFTASFTASTSTADDIAAGLQTNWNDQPELTSNIAVATVATNVVTLPFLHAGFVYIVTAPDQPSALTVANTQTAGGTSIELGVGVVQGSSDEFVVAPETGKVDADFIGITVRNVETNVNRGSAIIDDVFLPSDSVTVLREGVCAVVTEDAVAANAAVFVRVTATGTEKFGAFRSDVASGDAVQLLGAKFRTSTSGPGGIAEVTINRP